MTPRHKAEAVSEREIKMKKGFQIEEKKKIMQQQCLSVLFKEHKTTIERA